MKYQQSFRWKRFSIRVPESLRIEHRRSLDQGADRLSNRTPQPQQPQKCHKHPIRPTVRAI